MNSRQVLLIGVIASSPLLTAGAGEAPPSPDPAAKWSRLKTGDVLYREPQTHWVENIGTTPLHFLVTELRNPG